MLCYWLECRKNTEIKPRGLQRQIKENQCFYQNLQCVILKKKRFIKMQEASGLLSILGIKTGLDKFL